MGSERARAHDTNARFTAARHHVFFFSSRRRHTRSKRDWSSDVCSSDLVDHRDALGFGVVILPYHHPVRVAERVAMVDHMSGGRVEFGTGRSAPYEQIGMRSEERRVGKECRYRGAPWHETKKQHKLAWHA